MAKFDISGSVGRGLNPVDNRARDVAIRQEIEPPEVQKQMKMEEVKNTLEPMQVDEYMTEQNPLLTAAIKTVDWEGRRDKQGNLAVYKLPSGDMGGSYEVAGINDKYHPEAFKAISALPAQERARATAEYIQGYTAPLVEKLPPAFQGFMQDMAFNRGLGGATKYLQQGLNTLGLNVKVDGAIGPKTLDAINQANPRALMQAASKAQLDDEYRMAEKNPDRKKFIPGLESRINNRLSTFGQG